MIDPKEIAKAYAEASQGTATPDLILGPWGYATKDGFFHHDDTPMTTDEVEEIKRTYFEKR